MNELQTKQHEAASQLLALFDDNSPDERALAGPKCAYPAATALAEHALALALERFEDIVTHVMLGVDEHPNTPPQTDEAPEP